MGYSKMQESPHKEVCDFILKPGKRKKLLLLPRNSFKSSVVTVAGTMYRLLLNPNLRVLISSETQKNASKFAREIRQHYESNQRFRACYGDWVNHQTGWRDSEFIVAQRTKVLKESSVMASSLEKQNITGLHFDLIILDDVVSRNNTINSDQIDKTLDYYRLLLSVLDPEGDIYICGTRWSYLDLYAWIESQDNPENKNFDIMIKPAIASDGTLLMPEVLTQKFLDEQRATQGESIFSHQYLLQATVSEEQSFRPEQIQFYEYSPGGLFYFISVDPAISTEADADFTGLIVNGVDYDSHWWIQEAIEAKISPTETMDLIFKFAEKYQPMMAIGLEKFMLEKVFMLNLQEEMNKRGVSIPIKEVATDNRHSKEYRISSLKPLFEAGRIHIRKEHEALYRQIVGHPRIRHDDVIDALKTQRWITFPSDILPKAPEPEKPRPALSYREKEIWDKVASLGRRRVSVRSEYEL